MLLAKLYLNAAVYTGTAHYAEALTAAQAVIAGGYTLDPSYQHLFLADNHTSPELMFAVTQDGLKTQTWGGMTFLIHASCGGNMNATLYGIDGCWWGLRLKPEAYNRFAANDPRAGLLPYRRAGGRDRQHRQLQRRHRGAQVPQRDVDRRARDRTRPTSTPTTRCSGSPTRT